MAVSWAAGACPGAVEVSPRTVRWGGTLLPQAVGRAMEWPFSCPRRNLPPLPPIPLTSTAVCSMQALEQRRRFRALRVPSSPRLISNAAHRTGRSSVPAGQASTTGFAACNAGAESSGIITFSIFSSRYAAGAGAASNLDSSSSIRSTDTQSRWAHIALAACPVGGSMAKPNRAANRYSRRMRRASSSKRVAGSPTARRMPCCRSCCPPKGSMSPSASL